MKIALCSSVMPFVNGGGRFIVEWLNIMLQQAGHEVEIVYLPSIDHPELIKQQMLAYSFIDLTTADRIICFRPPAYVIPHAHKILWFIHHYRSFYDMWDTPQCPHPHSRKYQVIREMLLKLDTTALGTAKKIFTNSQIVADRLEKFNQVIGEVLYPPLLHPERFKCESFNDEVVYVCRIESHKRQDLLLEAMCHTKTPVKLRILGAKTDYSESLSQQIIALKLQDKVKIEDRWITEEEKVAVLANCLAAAYIPIDEDSYGYPSLEASYSSKPILTTSDSGGVLELVIDDYNGYVCEPDPLNLAEAMDKFYLERKQKTQQMGLNAREQLQNLKIDWSHVLDRLLA